jgi:hypothetical protein
MAILLVKILSAAAGRVVCNAQSIHYHIESRRSPQSDSIDSRLTFFCIWLHAHPALDLVSAHRQTIPSLSGIFGDIGSWL